MLSKSCPVNNLIPSLYANRVITDDDKKIMEIKPLEKDRVMYLLDEVLMRSLKSDYGKKYNGFLEVLQESDDPLAKELTKKLGELYYVPTFHILSCMCVFIVYSTSNPVLTLKENIHCICWHLM